MSRGTPRLAAFLTSAALAIAAAAVSPSAVATASSDLRLIDLDNRQVDPFQAAAGVKAFAFLFVSTECPVSNRYAPEIRRMSDAFAARGVAFHLVYPNPAESAEVIRAHVKDYSLPTGALRDPRQALVAFTKATITPEAAIYNAAMQRVYLGRIDDRYVNIGLERPAATRHDLQDALTAVLNGARISEPTTQAVGCYIADFAR
jgi:AhpC/TSA family